PRARTRPLSSTTRAREADPSSNVSVLVPPGPPHGEAREDEHSEEGEHLEPVRAAVPVDADVGDCKHRGAVESDRRPQGPLRDLFATLAPDEEDEERDREQKGDAREDPKRGERGLELQHDDDRNDREDDQEPAQCRVHPGEERSHVPVMYARTASAPATRVAPANQASRERRSAGAYSHGASTARSDSVP